ncbi:hypothetical protein [Kitasatospora kifunensis]|uniref:Uncharacterized protein n=1 Tax=Kitasatospora kifunensis TaxID=58351 RepID=A0A7W7VZW8_KITKI|nr:hypothetical protein [Kitasatospora kifunensis]MBB4928169.1 hypothetical protein [Kitasatospora kifunensis]
MTLLSSRRTAGRSDRCGRRIIRTALIALTTAPLLALAVPAEATGILGVGVVMPGSAQAGTPTSAEVDVYGSQGTAPNAVEVFTLTGAPATMTAVLDLTDLGASG